MHTSNWSQGRGYQECTQSERVWTKMFSLNFELLQVISMEFVNNSATFTLIVEAKQAMELDLQV